MRKTFGVTLVELLVVLAIMAIITAVALPLYTQFTQRTYYTEAQTDLLACAMGMERHASVNFTYRGAAVGPADAGVIDPGICNPLSVTATRYNNFTVAGTDTTFMVFANPTAQILAPVDKAISIDEAGARGFDTNDNGTIDAGEDNGWPDY